MREVAFAVAIPGCDVQQFWALTSPPEVTLRFHREANGDDTATVGAWASSGGGTSERLVCFTLAMAIPAALKSFVGAEPIRIHETQRITWLDEGTLLRIESLPVLQLAVAKALRTAAELTIRPAPDGGCSIDVKVTVSADVPWLLQSTVESVMADQAKKTVTQYTSFIACFVEEALTELNNRAAQQAVAAAGAVSQAAEAASQAVQQVQAGLEQQAAAGQLEQPLHKPGEAAGRLTVHAVVSGPPTPTPGLAQLQPLPPPPPQAAQQPQQQLWALPPPALAAAGELGDVWFDAQEALPSSAMEAALLRELLAAREARAEANRLLASIQRSVSQLEASVSRELAFHEGVRYGQRLGSGSLLLSVAAAAAAASAATAFVLSRRFSTK